MPLFNYEALDAKGKVVEGWMEAASVEVVIEELRSVNYTVTRVKEKRDYLASINDLFMKMQGVNLYTLAVFTRQFYTVLNAGIPLAKGLEGLARQSVNKKLQLVIYKIHDDILSGFSLTRALQKHPEVFSPVYTALIRAGEISGALGAIMERLAVFLEREYKLKQKVQSAMTYPAFVLVFSLLITYGLVNYIFPNFVSLLEGLDLDLPWPTLFLIHVTNITRNPFIITLMIVLIILTVLFGKQYLATPVGRRNLDKLKIDLPYFGKLSRKIIIARFCRTLGTLMESGLPMVHGLEIIGEVSGNLVFADIIEEITISLKGGMLLSQPMRSYPIFPPMVTNMVAVGEESGTLPTMLEKLSVFYDMEVETTLDSLVAMLEPLMIFFMGGLVAFILVAVFLPIYSILQKF